MQLSQLRSLRWPESFPTTGLSTDIAAALLLVLLVIISYTFIGARDTRRLPLSPPGGLPLLRNVLQMPKKNGWLVMHEWAKTSDLSSISIWLVNLSLFSILTLRHSSSWSADLIFTLIDLE